MMNLTKAQKKALNALFDFFPCKLIMNIPTEAMFADERTYGDLNVRGPVLVTKLFGIKPETLLELDSNAGFGKYHKFESIEDRDSFFESHYGETQVYRLERRICDNEDSHKLHIWIKELMATEGYHSDYSNCGNVNFGFWMDRLAPFVTNENVLYFKRNPHVSSYFSSRNHGTWVRIVKAFEVVAFINLLLSTKKLVPVT